MFCRYCGKEVKDKAVVCSGCGRPIDLSSQSKAAGKKWSFLMMLGLIGLTVIFPPVGLVFGLIGLANEDKKVQAAILLTVSIFMSLMMLAIVLGL